MTDIEPLAIFMFPQSGPSCKNAQLTHVDHKLGLEATQQTGLQKPGKGQKAFFWVQLLGAAGLGEGEDDSSSHDESTYEEDLEFVH